MIYLYEYIYIRRVKYVCKKSVMTLSLLPLTHPPSLSLSLSLSNPHSLSLAPYLSRTLPYLYPSLLISLPPSL